METEKLQIQDFKKVLPNYTKPIDDYPTWQAVEEELRLLFGLPNNVYASCIIPSCLIFILKSRHTDMFFRCKQEDNIIREVTIIMVDFFTSTASKFI